MAIFVIHLIVQNFSDVQMEKSHIDSIVVKGNCLMILQKHVKSLNM